MSSGTESGLIQKYLASPEERREGEMEKIFEEIMTKNVPNLIKIINPKAPKIPSTKNMKKTTPRHTITKLSKISDKEKNIKTPKEKEALHVQSNKDKNERFLLGTLETKSSGATSFKS